VLKPQTKHSGPRRLFRAVAHLFESQKYPISLNVCSPQIGRLSIFCAESPGRPVPVHAHVSDFSSKPNLDSQKSRTDAFTVRSSFRKSGTNVTGSESLLKLCHYKVIWNKHKTSKEGKLETCIVRPAYVFNGMGYFRDSVMDPLVGNNSL